MKWMLKLNKKLNFWLWHNLKRKKSKFIIWFITVYHHLPSSWCRRARRLMWRMFKWNLNLLTMSWINTCKISKLILIQTWSNKNQISMMNQKPLKKPMNQKSSLRLVNIINQASLKIEKLNHKMINPDQNRKTVFLIQNVGKKKLSAQKKIKLRKKPLKRKKLKKLRKMKNLNLKKKNQRFWNLRKKSRRFLKLNKKKKRMQKKKKNKKKKTKTKKTKKLKQRKNLKTKRKKKKKLNQRKNLKIQRTKRLKNLRLQLLLIQSLTLQKPIPKKLQLKLKPPPKPPKHPKTPRTQPPPPLQKPKMTRQLPLLPKWNPNTASTTKNSKPPTNNLVPNIL